MSLIDLFMAITLMYTVLSVLLIVIVGSSAWVMRTWAWWILGGAFAVWGLWRVSAFMRLPAAIMEAQMKGTMPTSLTMTQWFDAVFIPVLFLIGLIVGFGKLRYDLNKMVQRLKDVKVAESNHSKVMKGLDRLSAKVETGGDTGKRIEAANQGVADDLAAAHARADASQGGEAGAAADAAFQTGTSTED